MARNDFYEDDEPLEKLLAAFDAGEKVVTARPTRGRTEFFHLRASAQADVQGELVGKAHRTP